MIQDLIIKLEEKQPEIIKQIERLKEEHQTYYNGEKLEKIFILNEEYLINESNLELLKKASESEVLDRDYFKSLRRKLTKKVLNLQTDIESEYKKITYFDETGLEKNEDGRTEREILESIVPLEFSLEKYKSNLQYITLILRKKRSPKVVEEVQTEILFKDNEYHNIGI